MGDRDRVTGSEGGEELPDGLQRELRGMFEPSAGFPAGRDKAILHLAMRGRRGGRRWAISGAIAAAVAMAVGGMWMMHEGQMQRGAVYVRTGDVRDAFYLARELKGHKTPAGAGWDVNGDGVIDQRDVRELAMAAVRLPAEGGVR